MPWNTSPASTDIIAIHVALLPNGEKGDILCFGDWTKPDNIPQNEYTHSRIYHVATDSMEPFDQDNPDHVGRLPDTNAFCCGQAFLADGRLLAGGGTFGWPDHAGLHGEHYDGERACWLYLPRAKRWVRARDFNFQPDSDSIGGGRWYPTLVTLSNGEVFAAAGHPAETDDYPLNGPEKRHNNNTPERYSPSGNKWTLMTSAITAPNGFAYETDAYPRFHLLPNGLLFCDTAGDEGPRRIFNPYTGVWTGPNVDVSALPGYYSRGSRATSVMLPLLPPNYKARVLACNSPNNTAFRIEVNDNPKWVPTTARTGAAAGKQRDNACAVLLPTGQVFISGGITPVAQTPDPDDAELPNIPILAPEIYDPGDFTGQESWTTGEAAKVGRGYHSTALLLPDGRVWTAGSTETANAEDTLRPSEKRIEIYSPAYVGQPRPTIEAAPAFFGYGKQFVIDVAAGNQIGRVALMRCGSITHAYDSDQRYVGLNFTAQGDKLTVTSPPNASIAPPGYYMLWVIDTQGRPCHLAKFVRLTEQTCEIITDRSTFSRLEVEATFLDPDAEGLAVFANAFYVYYDGFMPHELGVPGGVPNVKLAWDSPNGAVPNGISFKLSSPGYDDDSAPPDVGQRFTFLYDLRFHNINQFDFPATDRMLFVTISMGGLTCQAQFRLMKKPNPYMKDGNPHWLSKDLRVFQITPGTFPKESTTQFAPGDTPETFLDKLLKEFDGLPDNSEHPFNKLSTGQEGESILELATTVDDVKVYNFAVAKVRYKSISEPASGVRVLFRLFNTVGTALEWTSGTTYRREVKGPAGRDTVALMGMTGGNKGEIISIPFFAAPRVTPQQKMPDQFDDLNKRDLPGQGATETTRYFGCWLDFNQEKHHFPLYPMNDGPYSEDPLAGGPLYSVLDLIRNYHQCLVAEIYFEDDKINFGDTPGSSDNLSQRNLVLEMSSNPGDAASRRVATTMWVRPSQMPKDTGVNPLASVSTAALAGRFKHDELVIWWKNLPSGASVDLYIPSVDVDEMLRVAGYRASANPLEKVDAHTIRSTRRSVTYIPLPGGLTKLIPCLLSVQLPEGVTAGQEFRAVVQQYSGATRKVIGAIELRIPVRHEEAILPGELKKLAVLKYIQTKIPQNDRWFPVFDRYVGYMGERVRGLGGDPEAVEPTNHVTTRPRPHRPETGGEGQTVEGKVASLLYDCSGNFEGFILDTCGERTFIKTCEHAVEEVVRRACRERNTISVSVGRGGLLRIAVHCC